MAGSTPVPSLWTTTTNLWIDRHIGTQLIACTPVDDASDALMTGDRPGAAVSAIDGVIGRGVDADPLLEELLAIGVELGRLPGCRS